jgi:hypothetical protein
LLGDVGLLVVLLVHRGLGGGGGAGILDSSRVLAGFSEGGWILR